MAKIPIYWERTLQNLAKACGCLSQGLGCHEVWLTKRQLAGVYIRHTVGSLGLIQNIVCLTGGILDLALWFILQLC